MLRLETILAATLRHVEVAGELGEALKSDLVVANPFYRSIVDFYLEFQGKTKVMPKGGDVELWLLSLPEGLRLGTQEHWNRVITEDISSYTPSFLAEQALPVLRQVATQNALARLNASTDLSPELLTTLSGLVSNIQALGLHDLADIRDVTKWIRPDTLEWTIPTGIHGLDKQIGGWSEELIFILADSGVGKSTFLINTAQHAALLGKKVFVVSFELSKARYMHRLYRRITETDLPTYRAKPAQVIERANHWLKLAKGVLKVHYEPAYTIASPQLRVLVDKFAQAHGGIDVLILDMMDLMTPGKGATRSTYDDLGRISHETRSLCPDYKMAAISAAQATRAKGRTRLHLEDMADSYGKVRAAGIVAGLCQTDEEIESMQARLGILKARDNPGRGQELPVFVDMDLMYIADLDHANTQRIIRQRHPKLAVSLGDVHAN